MTNIDGKTIWLSCSTTGRYLLSLIKWNMRDEKTKIILYAKRIVKLNKSERDTERVKKALELHWCFADASKENLLLKLVKESKGFDGNEFMKFNPICSCSQDTEM